ncbi:MAG: hypothetical protein U0X76_09295 [Bacteroidia bacterium]
MLLDYGKFCLDDGEFSYTDGTGTIATLFFFAGLAMMFRYYFQALLGLIKGF